MITEQIITFDAMEQAVSLFGSFDENIKLIEKEFAVSIISRGSDLKIVGDAENVSFAVRAVNALLTLINKGETLSDQNVRYAIGLVKEGNDDKLAKMATDTVCITAKGKPIKAKNHWAKKVLRGNKQKHDHLRRRPRRHGQNLSCRGACRNCFQSKAG